MNRLNVIIMTYMHSVMLSVSETPSAGRPLSGTLRVPPLPLQRESILPEGWFIAKMNAIKKPKRKIKILRFGFFGIDLRYIKTLPSTNETKCSLRPKIPVISVRVISPYKCFAYNFLSCRFAVLSPAVFA